MSTPIRKRKRDDGPAREAGREVIRVVRELVEQQIVTPKQLAIAATGTDNGCPISKIINEGREPLSGWLVAAINNIENAEARRRLRNLIAGEERMVVPESEQVRGSGVDGPNVASDVVARVAGILVLINDLDRQLKAIEEQGNAPTGRRLVLRQAPELIQRLKLARTGINRLGAWINDLQEQAMAFRRARPAGLRLADEATDAPASENISQVDPRTEEVRDEA